MPSLDFSTSLGKGRLVKQLHIHNQVHTDSVMSSSIIDSILQRLPSLLSYEDNSWCNVLHARTVARISTFSPLLGNLQLHVVGSDFGIFAAVNQLKNLESLTIIHCPRNSQLHPAIFQRGLVLPHLRFFHWACKNITGAAYEHIFDFFALCVLASESTLVLDMNMDLESDDNDVDRMLPFFTYNTVANLKLRQASWALQRLVARQRILQHLIIQQCECGIPDMDLLIRPIATPVLSLQLNLTASSAIIYLTTLVEAIYLQQPEPGALFARQVRLELTIHAVPQDQFDSRKFSQAVKETGREYRQRRWRLVELEITFSVSLH